MQPHEESPPEARLEVTPPRDSAHERGGPQTFTFLAFDPSRTPTEVPMKRPPRCPWKCPRKKCLRKWSDFTCSIYTCSAPCPCPGSTSLKVHFDNVATFPGLAPEICLGSSLLTGRGKTLGGERQSSLARRGCMFVGDVIWIAVPNVQSEFRSGFTCSVPCWQGRDNHAPFDGRSSIWKFSIDPGSDMISPKTPIVINLLMQD